jgi:hypothetical protein
MFMSELIERYEAEKKGGLYWNPLARALVKTGPLIHRNWYYSAKKRYGRYELTASLLKRPRKAGDAVAVEVPWGMLPGVPGAGHDTDAVNSALIDRLRSFSHDLESGVVTAGNPEDAESLADNLEALADEIRHWTFSNDLMSKAEQFMARYAIKK